MFSKQLSPQCVVGWGRTRLLLARHIVLAPMVALGLVNQNWLLTGGGWQDPWRTFETFTNLGSLSPEAQAFYKSTRTVLVLCGQILVWFLGNYWGQVGLAVMNLIAMYLSIRYLLMAVYGKAHPLAIAIVFYLPSLHGVGGWMLGVSFSLPLIVVSLTLAIKLLDLPNEPSHRGAASRIGVLLGLSCTLIWFIHPGALPFLLSALLFALVFDVVRTERHKIIRNSMAGFLFGSILGVLIGELSGFVIGRRSSATLAAIDWYFFLLKEENMSTFRRNLTSWFGEAIYLAPIGIGLSLVIGMLLTRRRSIGLDRSITRKSAALLGMCFTAVTFYVAYEVNRGTVLAYEYYASNLTLYGGLIAAISLQFMLESRDNHAIPPNGSGLLVLISTVFIIVGWQLAGQPIPRPGMILTAILAWCAVGGILCVSSARSGLPRMTLWCFGALMFGTLSGEPQYAVATCPTREMETRAILSLISLADSGYFRDRLGPVFVLDVPPESSTSCEPSASNVRSSVSEQILPFQEAFSDLKSNAIAHPNASTLLLGTSDRQVQQILQVANEVPELKDTLVARPIPNIDGVAALEVFHRDLTELTRLLKPIVDESDVSMTELVDRLFWSETYLTLTQLIRDEPKARIAVIATSESDVLSSLFRNVLGISLRSPVVAETGTPSLNICESIGEFPADIVVVGRGVIDDVRSLDLLAKAKAEVRDCLGSIGWEFVEEPSNSESPLVIYVVPSK